MIQDSNMTFILQAKMPARSGTETVPSRSNPSNAFSLESFDHCVYTGDPCFRCVFSDPGVDIKPGGVEVNDGVIIENIWGYDPIPVPSEIVHEKLYTEKVGVGEVSTKFLSGV